MRSSSYMMDQMLLKPPWSTDPLMMTAMMPANMKQICTTSVHITAFIPPFRPRTGKLWAPGTTRSTIMPISHRRRGRNKTVLSCLVRVGGVNWIADKTRQFCSALSQFSICNCSVSNIFRTTETCLDLSPIQFTPQTRTSQDNLVLSCPCRRCELGITSTVLSNATFLLRPDRGAQYCDQLVCLSVCVCICLSVREHIFGTAEPIFAKFCTQIPVAVGSVVVL